MSILKDLVQSMDVPAFLNFILYGGGSALAVSWISERLTWFQAQLPERKKRIQFQASTVVSLLAYLIVTYVPVDVLSVLTPIFTIIAGSFVFYYGGQEFHEKDKLTAKEEVVQAHAEAIQEIKKLDGS